MKSNIKRVIIGLIFLTCVVVVVNILSKEVQGNMREKEFQTKEIIGIEGYTTYTSQKFGVSFEYPKNWELSRAHPLIARESSPYKGGIGIDIRGPVESKSKIGHTGLNFDRIPTKKTGGMLNTIDEYAQFTTKSRGFGKTKKVISDVKITLAGLEAREITISYDIKVPPRAIKQIPVTRIKKWIIVKKDGYFYDLKFSTSEDDYPKYIEAYERAKKTFKFLK